MASARDGKPVEPAPAAPRSGSPSPVGREIDWKVLWPLPVLVLATGLFVAGIVTAVSSRPEPDYAEPLRRAEAMYERGESEAAIEVLNKEMVGPIAEGKIGEDLLRDFHMLRARAFADGQAALGVSREYNDKVIVEDFAEGERLGATLSADDLGRVTEAHLSLGNFEAAVQRAGSLPSSESARRTRLIKRIVEKCLRAPKIDRDLCLRLLGELSSSPEVSGDDAAWTLARQCELLLAEGDAPGAINRLLMRIGRIEEVGGESGAELLLLLGRAYVQTGEAQNAEKSLRAAIEHLPEDSAKSREASVLLGRILMQDDRTRDEARDRLAEVVETSPGSPSFPDALLSLAEVEAARGELEASLERYEQLARTIRERGDERSAILEPATASLLERYRDQAGADRWKPALRFATIAESMYTAGQAPAPVILALAEVHRRIGDEILASARAAAGDSFRVDELDEVTRGEVKGHYLRSGALFRRHAALSAGGDAAQFLNSMWSAADALDLAGDLGEAGDAFRLYADQSPDDDPRRSEAMFRLGQIYQARRDYTTAATYYRDLVARATASGVTTGTTGAGLWGDRSIVPLARCLLDDSEPANDAEGEELLRKVVDGRVMSPEAAEFADAIIELGSMLYARGRYAEAIGRLEEAVGRIGDEPRATGVRYRLADALRLSAKEIEATLGKALPQAERQALTHEREERLRRAGELFAQVREELEVRARAAGGERMLKPLERVQARNSSFYVGDCAFDLGDYDASIALYDDARKKYADDPSSLVAMVQIVSAHAAMGRWPAARAASESARRALARFPESAWTDSSLMLPMEKQHWERWLDSRTLIEAEQRAAAGEEPGTQENDR